MDDTPRMDSLSYSIFHSIDFENRKLMSTTNIMELRNINPSYIIKEDVGYWNRYAIYQNQTYSNPYKKLTIYNSENHLIDKITIKNWSLQLNTDKISSQGFDVFNITKIYATYIDCKSESHTFSPESISEAINVFEYIVDNFVDFGAFINSPLLLIKELSKLKEENIKLTKP
jgi:hypothetical protein